MKPASSVDPRARSAAVWSGIGRRPGAELLLAVGVWVIGATVFYRKVISSGFDRINGDQGDTRLVVAIHEHWLDVLSGDRSWRDPAYFHPTRGVLGFTDTFLLNVPVYGSLRFLGADQWIAIQLTTMVLSLVGFLATYLVLRRIVGAGPLVSCAMAATFAFGNNMAVSADHPQLPLVNWLPVIVLLAWAGARSSDRRRAVASSAAAGALLGLTTYSAFYIGWFAVLAALVFLMCLGALRIGSGSLRELVDAARSHARSIGSFAAGLVVSLVPFVFTYVPILDDSDSRSYADVMNYAPRPMDIVNLGQSNFVWAPAMDRLMGDEPKRLTNIEISLALTPTVLVLVLLSGVVLVRRRRNGVRSLGTDASIAAVLSVAILTLLPVKWDVGSLWVIPWHLMPGAMGVRVGGRLQLVTSLLASVAIAGGITCLLRSLEAGAKRRWVGTALVGLALSLAVVEQLNVRESTRLDRSGEQLAASKVPDPPASCRSFFMAPEPGRPAFAVGTDALLIAVDFGIPTVNGYSGTTPKGYRIDPTTDDYLAQVEAWAAQHRLEPGLCSFHRLESTWDVEPFED